MSISPRKRLLWICFALVVLVQLGAAGWMIGRWERILTQGEVMRLECQPIDPLDAFRGRYVELNVKRTEVTGTMENPIGIHEPAFVSYDLDSHGYAQFTTVNRERPETGNYLRCRVNFHPHIPRNATYEVIFPFTKYFMNERLAPHAEEVFRNATRGSAQGYLKVRVLNGKAVLEDVYVGDKPLGDLAKELLRTAEGA